MKQTNKLTVCIILGVMCVFLTAGIFIQVRTVSSSTTTVGRTHAENELRDSVLRWKEKYENAYQKLEKKEEELEKLRNQVSNSSDSASGLSTSLEEYNKLLGYTDVKGPGIVITLKDGDSSIFKGPTNSIIVHDEDLFNVVNALKNAGAEAISINGQRITSRTGISCVGNVITVNGQKIGAPFVVNAIGPAVQLHSSLTMPGGYLSLMEAGGVQIQIDQFEKSTVEVPKFEGIYKTEYVSNIE